MGEDGDYQRQLDLYDRLHRQVEHENQLYNQRIVWLLSMQAFLFATVSLALQAKLNVHDPGLAWQVDCFIGLMCATGFAVSVISHRVLANGRTVLDALRRSWDEQVAAGALPGYPHASGGGGRATHAMLRRSGNLPYLFALVWVAATGFFFFGAQIRAATHWVWAFTPWG
jgi:hypothetical protein